MARKQSKGSDSNEADIPGLQEAWESPNAPFGEYVKRVAAAYQTSRLSLSVAAALLETSPMELLAITQLASLQEEALEVFDGPPPPKTTWFYFAQATEAGSVRDGLAALSRLKKSESPAVVVRAAMATSEGPTPEDKINALEIDVLWHMWKKSKQYDVLGERGRKALANMTGKKGRGFPMSLAQLTFMKGLLNEMADAGAIKRSSPDGDQRECDVVLDALGR